MADTSLLHLGLPDNAADLPGQLPPELLDAIHQAHAPQVPAQMPQQAAPAALPMISSGQQAPLPTGTDTSDNDLANAIQRIQARRDATNAANNPGGVSINDALIAATSGISGGLSGNPGGGVENRFQSIDQARQNRMKQGALDDSKQIADLIALAKLRQGAQEQDLNRQSKADLQKMRGSKGMGGMTEPQQARLNLRSDTQAADVAKAIENEHVIKDLNARKVNVGIAYHTLTSGGMVTPQMIDEISSNVASAISGSNGATVSANQRQEINNVEKDWASLKQRMLSRPEEATNPAVKKQLSDLLVRLDTGYNVILPAAVQRFTTGQNFPHNPEAQRSIQQKKDQYSNLPSLEPMAASNDYAPDVMSYASSHGISPQQAQAIKATRSGVK